MQPSAAISETMQVGPYRLLRQIGAGGMGSVWLAEHRELGRRAAIKVLHPECSSRPDVVRRFFNEARAATAIADPGIVQIFDFGRHSDGSAYIVMELLDGEPLDRRLAQKGTLAIIDALRILRQVASALAAAHARGIIHRDLKPENIYLARDAEVAGGERAKILDFGIAKVLDDKATVRTHTSAIIGTPIYMSPEQCRGAGEVDQRSDIYSLGCVLFTLLAGRPPFISDGPGELIVMHLCEAAPLASAFRPGIPADVDALIARCLAKQPDSRFASAADLASALAALEQRVDPSRALTPLPLLSDAASPLAAPEPHATQMSTTLSSSAGSATALPAPRRGRVVVIGALLAALAFTTWGVARAGAKSAPRHAPIAATAPVSSPREAAVASAPAPIAMAPAPAVVARVTPTNAPVAPPAPAATLSAPAPAPLATPAAPSQPQRAAKKHAHHTSTVSTAAAQTAFDDDGMPTHR